MVIYLSLLVAVLGLLVYVLASKAEVKELGRIAYGVGLLAFLLKIAESAIHIP